MACAGQFVDRRRGTLVDEYRRDRNNFYMDLENYALEHVWRAPAPTGPARHLNSAWGQMMRAEMVDYDPPKTYVDYCSWVEHGGGDDWFQPAEPENPCRYRESAMPLPVASNAASVNGHDSTTDDLRRIRQAGG